MLQLLGLLNYLWLGFIKDIYCIRCSVWKASYVLFVDVDCMEVWTSTKEQAKTIIEPPRTILLMLLN